MPSARLSWSCCSPGSACSSGTWCTRGRRCTCRSTRPASADRRRQISPAARRPGRPARPARLGPGYGDGVTDGEDDGLGEDGGLEDGGGLEVWLPTTYRVITEPGA